MQSAHYTDEKDFGQKGDRVLKKSDMIFIDKRFDRALNQEER